MEVLVPGQFYCAEAEAGGVSSERGCVREVQRKPDWGDYEMSALGQRQERPRRPFYDHNYYVLQGKTISLLGGELITVIKFTFSISADEDAAPGPISRHAMCHVRRLVDHT